MGNIKLEWDNANHYWICSSVTIPKKALRKGVKKGLTFLNVCAEMMGKAAQRTEMPDPKQTRGRHCCAAALLLPWKAVGIALMVIPLHCFCFTTLYLTANTIKRSKAQH